MQLPSLVLEHLYKFTQFGTDSYREYHSHLIFRLADDDDR